MTRKCLFSFLLLYSLESLGAALAPVSGFARSFLSNHPLANAKITVLETQQEIKTDENGHFGPILYPVGKAITLRLKKWGYKTTQSVTLVVPPEGLTDAHHNITFQVPSIITYYLFVTILGANTSNTDCHVATTVIGYHKTLDDLPQGEAHAKIKLMPAMNVSPFYFDIFKRGWLIKDKTNPFTKGLAETSHDGGVAFVNLPPRDEPYRITAEKDGKQFTTAQFLCKKDAFINISPPNGPMVLN